MLGSFIFIISFLGIICLLINPILIDIICQVELAYYYEGLIKVLKVGNYYLNY